mmetsp:Transcript_111758/g.312397  ORF Transcript_111758/g.312397 Transcript_111758/m.312397 type:complete len:187 (+) Transcript_111758:186-746(+)
MFRFIITQLVVTAFVAECTRSSPYEKEAWASERLPAAVAAQPGAGLAGAPSAAVASTRRRGSAEWMAGPASSAGRRGTHSASSAWRRPKPQALASHRRRTSAAAAGGGRLRARAVMRGVAALAAVCSLVVAMWRSASAAQVALRDTAPGRSPVLQPGPHTTVPAPAAHRAEENVAPGREPFIKVDE